MKQDQKSTQDSDFRRSLPGSSTSHAPHTPEAGWCFPAVGLSVGLGLGFVESVFVLHPMLEQFGGGGILMGYLPVLLGYALVGSGVDLGVQCLWLVRGLDAPGWVLGGVATALVAVLGMVIGQLPSLFGVQLCFMMFWAWAALKVRWLGAASLVWVLVPMTHGQRLDAPALSDTASVGGDIVLVVLDSLRWDHSSAYGYERPTTPHMESLAAQGQRFERAYAAAPWSLPSHASLFTGRMPGDHGAHNERMRFDSSWPTLAESLGEAGYETVGFSASPYAGTGPGTARGFHRFSDYWPAFTVRQSTFGWRVWTRLTGSDRDKGGRNIVADVRSFVAGREPGRPMFLFVNLMEAHSPYQDVPLENRRGFSAESSGRLERAGIACHRAQSFDTRVSEADRAVCMSLLDGASQAADARLGEVLALFDEDTLVIVTSDHGDEVGEHGRYGHNTGLRETVLRVPLIMAGPGVPVGGVESSPVSLLDVAPTLLSYAGLEPRGLPGRDLLGGTGSSSWIRAEHWRTEVTTAGWRLAHPGRDYSLELARTGAVVGERFKRVVSQTGLDQGFDLLSDAQEKLPFTGEATELPAWLPGPQ
ncbi:MAG: sulfatase [Myxococcota bacterium]|nr:sulfatase [Myxococcota bacterium]